MASSSDRGRPQGYSEVFASMPRRPQSENLRTSLVFSLKCRRCLPFDSNSTSGPPPAHLMNTGSASQTSSGQVDGSRGSLSSLGSSGPIRPLPKSAPGANSGSSGSGAAPLIELAADLKSAKVHPNGSRFASVAPGENVSTMGWHVPLAKIGRTPRGSCNRTLLRRVPS